MKTIPALLVIFQLTSCVTHDKAIVYHAGYNPGGHRLLRFDGYYSDTLHSDPYRGDYEYPQNSIRPKFFYANGTSILGGTFPNQDTLSSYFKRGWNNIGLWSNYKISNDTIVIESFSHDGGTGNYYRSIETGIIQQDKIFFPAQTIREGQTHKSYYTFFRPFNGKPDSSANWIRTNKYYGRTK